MSHLMLVAVAVGPVRRRLDDIRIRLGFRDARLRCSHPWLKAFHEHHALGARSGFADPRTFEAPHSSLKHRTPAPILSQKGMYLSGGNAVLPGETLNHVRLATGDEIPVTRTARLNVEFHDCRWA